MSRKSKKQRLFLVNMKELPNDIGLNKIVRRRKPIPEHKPFLTIIVVDACDSSYFQGLLTMSCPEVQDLFCSNLIKIISNNIPHNTRGWSEVTVNNYLNDICKDLNTFFHRYSKKEVCDFVVRMNNPFIALEYVTNIIGKEEPRFEPIIATSAYTAYRYAKFFGKRFELGEKVIIGTYYAYDYGMMISELEKSSTV